MKPIVDIQPYLPRRPAPLALARSNNGPLLSLVRQSSRRGSDLSIDRQREECAYAAARMGREIDKEFVEDDVSGRGLLHERPILLDALKYAADSLVGGAPVAGFIATAVHRIARRGSVAHTLWEFCEERDLKLWMTSSSSPLSRSQFDVEASLAATSWETTLRDLHNARRIAAQSGKQMGPPAWGYKKLYGQRSELTGRDEDGRREIIKELAPSIVYAFELFVDQDLSVDETISALYEADILPPSGEWTSQKLIGSPGKGYGIFGNLYYVGWQWYDFKPKQTIALNEYVDREPRTNWDPRLVIIWDADLWRRARAKVERLHDEILSRRAERSPATKPAPPIVQSQAEILLKGLVHCGCGASLKVVATRAQRVKCDDVETDVPIRTFGHPTSPKQSGAICTMGKTYPVDGVDAAVLKLLEEGLTTLGDPSSIVEAFAAAHAREDRKLSAEKARLKRSLVQLDEALERAEVGAWRNFNSLLARNSERRYEKTIHDRRDLAERLEALERFRPSPPPARSELADLLAGLDDMRRRLPFEAASAEDFAFRAVLHSLVERVEVRRINKRDLGVKVRGPLLHLLLDDYDPLSDDVAEWEFKISNRRADGSDGVRVEFLI